MRCCELSRIIICWTKTNDGSIEAKSSLLVPFIQSLGFTILQSVKTDVMADIGIDDLTKILRNSSNECKIASSNEYTDAVVLNIVSSVEKRKDEIFGMNVKIFAASIVGLSFLITSGFRCNGHSPTGIVEVEIKSIDAGPFITNKKTMTFRCQVVCDKDIFGHRLILRYQNRTIGYGDLI